MSSMNNGQCDGVDAAASSDSGAGELQRRVLLGAMGLVGMAALGRMASAGPINPPVGPVGSTAKSLGEVEPRTAINATNTPGDATAVFILQAEGSYYLMADVFVPSGKIGIKILSSALNVTIDMNGFKIGGATGSGAGIATVAAVGGSTLAIRNGKVQNMGGAGVSVNAQTLLVDGVAVNDCAGIGLDLSGNAGRVLNCGAFRCGSHGFSIGMAATMAQCAAEFNMGTGFFSGSAVVFESCVASLNTGGGFRAGTLRASNCMAVQNGGTSMLGIDVLSAQGCEVNAGSTGFSVSNPGSSANLSGCLAVSMSGVGYFMPNASGAMLAGCAARACAGGGFQPGPYAMLTACMASGNGVFGGSSSGFILSTGSRGENCGATQNAQHGFLVTSGCTLTNCTAADNGSAVLGNAGFRATGADTTFDSCTATGNPVGFNATGGCILTRNRASGNTTNFSLIGTNFLGAIVTTAAGVATANGWANFEF